MTCITIPRTPWILRTLILAKNSRLASTSASPPQPPPQPIRKPSRGRSRDIFISQCIRILHQRTKQPLWRLLGVLDVNAPKTTVTAALEGAGIAVKDYRLYRGQVKHNNLALTLSNVQVAVASNHDHDHEEVLPDWFFLYLVTKHCRSPSDSLALQSYLFRQLEKSPPHVKAPMLIFAAAHLATWNLVVPLDKVVDQFLELPHPIRTPVRLIPPSSPSFVPNDSKILSLTNNDEDKKDELYFNLFLRALACVPIHSRAYSDCVTSILTRLSTLSVDPRAPSNLGGRFKIHEDTYSCLLMSTPSFLYSTNARYNYHPRDRDRETPTRILSPSLATSLRAHMEKQGLKPSPMQLEALLRFWAKEAVGNAHPESERAGEARGVVKELWEELHRMDQDQGKGSGLEEEVGLVLGRGAGGVDHVLRANTLYLGAQGTIQGVQEVSALFERARSAREHQGTVESEAVSPAAPTTEDLSQPQPQDPTPPPPTQPPLLPRAKPTFDAYDLTASLHSASNDRSISTTRFISLFDRLLPLYRGGGFESESEHDRHIPLSAVHTARQKIIHLAAAVHTAQYKIPVAAHTVFLRGLMFRGEYELAREWWERGVCGIRYTRRSGRNVKYSLERGGFRQQGGIEELDRKVVTAGVQVLTRCGRPHEAFMVLERVGWKPYYGSSSLPPSPTSTSPFPSSSSTSPFPSTQIHTQPQQPTRLSSISITEWMVSLKRIARPDVVFRVWDYMYPLYGVLHTTDTLNVLLQSARMAVIIDSRSVRTQLSNYIKIGLSKLVGFGGGTSGSGGMGGSGEGAGEGVAGEGGGGGGHRVLDASRKTRFEGKKAIEILVGRNKKDEAKPYKGGLWRGKRPEDAAREVFLQVLFGMEVELSSVAASGLLQANTNTNDEARQREKYNRVGLANVRAPACAVRKDWDSDGGAVGLGVGLVELKLHRFEYRPGPEMYDWSHQPSSPSPPFPSPSSPTSSSSTSNGSDLNTNIKRQLQPRPRSHYPHLSLDDSNFLSYLSLLSVTNRTGEVALTMAWMRELGGIQPSEDTLALALVLWEEVSVEAPLVEAMARYTSSASTKKRHDGIAEGEKERQEEENEGQEEEDEERGERRPPANEYERFVVWMEDWVGRRRIPDQEALMKWRGIVKAMREARPRLKGHQNGDSDTDESE